MKKVTLFFGMLIFFTACSDKKVNEELIDKKKYAIRKNEVGIQILKKKPFQKELISNGKLFATQKTNLKFEVSERLEKINVQNGMLVQKGQELAVLRSRRFEQKLKKAILSLKKAQLDLEDKVLGRGFSLDEKDKIPSEAYEMLLIKSGYKDAEQQLEDAKYELNSSSLQAPFKGKIANLKSKEYDQISSSKDFLTLIDDSNFEVAFYVIESEVGEISVSDEVAIIPFALETTYKAKVSEINPVVEKNGTILIKALVKNDGRLLEGMNVKVLLKKEIPNQWVVPKSAVILRQNQEVLFKIVNGQAYWTYVLTTNENSSSYAVIPHPDKSSASLSLKDTIIVSGNLNLAHESDVFIKRKPVKNKKKKK